MAMTYRQKRNLLSYLGNPGHWKVRDITAFLLDPDRKKNTGQTYNIKTRAEAAEEAARETIEDARRKRAEQKPAKNKPLWSNKASVVPFRYEDWPEEQRRDLINHVKLVVALDLNLEPNMPACNKWELDKEQERKKNFKLVERPWQDTTEFEGFYTGLTRRFAIEATKGGFILATTLEHKEAIINQAGLVTQISNQQNLAAAIADRATHNAILAQLEKGAAAQTPYDGEWLYTLLKTQEPGALRKTALHLFGDLADIEREKFSILTLKADEMLIAANRERLGSALKARKATMAFLKAAEQGLPQGEEPAAFLQRMQKAGADARYVDPEGLSEAFTKAVSGSRNGKSLADVFAEILLVREDYKTLAKMKKSGLINEFTLDWPDPPTPPQPGQ